MGLRGSGAYMLFPKAARVSNLLMGRLSAFQGHRGETDKNVLCALLVTGGLLGKHLQVDATCIYR